MNGADCRGIAGAGSRAAGETAAEWADLLGWWTSSGPLWVQTSEVKVIVLCVLGYADARIGPLGRCGSA
ncbi:hypothetical protein [Devriesea agamarum]|uniref:hypothetical protein n=1 Tax=Devriesea agamarum TaxID=472569 RepID=UPI00071C87EC|nr:hypothetical protein [Devriesea agamarum]